MHASQYEWMRGEIAVLTAARVRVLDVGSRDVNGSFRPLVVERGWEYTGLDLSPGPGVDVVALGPYQYPFDDGEFDVVISGSTLEHVERPWLWIREVARVLRRGGHLLLHTLWQFPPHDYPVDCWRFLPHGLRVLAAEAGTLRDVEVRILNEQDVVMKARKR